MLVLLLLGIGVLFASGQQSSTRQGISATGVITVGSSSSTDKLTSHVKSTPSYSSHGNISVHTHALPPLTSSIKLSSSDMTALSQSTLKTMSVISSSVSTRLITSTSVMSSVRKISSSTVAGSSIQPAPATTVPIMASSSAYPTPTHSPSATVIVYKCGDECISLKRRLYTSAVFAVLFLVVSIILSMLLFRQYQISKDYQNDPTLSRLI